MRLIINATNIHSGGGAILLTELIHALENETLPMIKKFVLYIDNRYSAPKIKSSKIDIYRVNPQILPRLFAELKFYNVSQEGDLFLSLTNLPPLFHLKSKTYILLHNYFLIGESVFLKKFKIRTRIRIFIERFWLKSFIRNADFYIFQTLHMSKLFHKNLDSDARPIRSLKLPFFTKLQKPNNSPSKDYDFVYVASAEPHKNHERLLSAWLLLKQDFINPRLALTCTKKDLIKHTNIKEEIFHKLQGSLFFLENKNRSELLKLLSRSETLIFPSLAESFGLPLIEAQKLGLYILASENDFVREVVQATSYFDPNSEKDIASCVKKFIATKKTGEVPLPTLNLMYSDGKEFIEKLSEHFLSN